MYFLPYDCVSRIAPPLLLRSFLVNTPSNTTDLFPLVILFFAQNYMEQYDHQAVAREAQAEMRLSYASFDDYRPIRCLKMMSMPPAKIYLDKEETGACGICSLLRGHYTQLG